MIFMKKIYLFFISIYFTYKIKQENSTKGGIEMIFEGLSKG